MRRMFPFLVAGLVVGLVGLGLSLFSGLGDHEGTARMGSTLSTADRRELNAPPVVRGADAPPVDPAVDLFDPEAVARAYLVAAHTLTADDAGHTQLRAAGYAAPGPAATVGVLVIDPPPPGQTRRATVRALDLVASDPTDGRRAYVATVETATGPPGGAAETAQVTAQIVLAHQPDGRWLVAAETVENPDLT